jgi:hypothetical protein
MGSWAMPLLAAGYLSALAYLASFINHRTALWLGGRPDQASTATIKE